MHGQKIPHGNGWGGWAVPNLSLQEIHLLQPVLKVSGYRSTTQHNQWIQDRSGFETTEMSVLGVGRLLETVLLFFYKFCSQMPLCLLWNFFYIFDLLSLLSLCIYYISFPLFWIANNISSISISLCFKQFLYTVCDMVLVIYW